MKFLTPSILLIFLLAGMSAVAGAQTHDKDRRELTSLIRQMTDAQAAYDAAALDRLFTPDYLEISPAGELDSREKVLGFYSPEAKAEAGDASVALDISEQSFRLWDKTAVVVAKFTYTITANSKQMPPRNIRAAFVFRKLKGSWKIASAQYTGIRPPAPTK